MTHAGAPSFCVAINRAEKSLQKVQSAEEAEAILQVLRPAVQPLWRTGDFAAAQRACSLDLRWGKPQTRDALRAEMYVGELYYEMSSKEPAQIEQAIKIFSSMLSRRKELDYSDETQVKLNCMMGMSLYRAKRFEESIKYFELAANYNKPLIFRDWGKSYRIRALARAGRTDDARKALREFGESSGSDRSQLLDLEALVESRPSGR